MAEKKKKKKWIKWVVLGVLAAIIGFGTYTVYKAVEQTKKIMDSVVPSVEVAKDTIKVVVQASGPVDSVNKIDVFAPFDATISELPFKDGDVVKKGDVLVFLKNEDLDDEIDDLEAKLDDIESQLQLVGAVKSSSITTPVAGRVKAVYVEKNQDVSAAMASNGALFLISADNKMEIRIPSDNRKAGEAVKIVIGEKTVNGSISDIIGSEAVILITDEAYETGASVNVTDPDGNTLASGSLAIHAPYLITAGQGVISEVSVKVNDKVYASSQLAYLKDSVYPDSYYDLLDSRRDTMSDIEELQAHKDQMQIVSPADGIISGLGTSINTPVQEDMLLMTIKGTDAMEVKVAVDELDIANVQVGQSANIIFDALQNRIFTGSVTKISAVGTVVGGVTTYDVTVLMDDFEGIYNGMSGRADILTATKSDVIVIPASCIKTIDGEKYVMVVPPPTAKDALTAVPIETKITIGLYTGAEAEVISGLTEGQYIQDLNADTGLESLIRMQNAGMGG
jgi:HlyD family secretion protein